MGIPKIIHQIWIGLTPDKHLEWAKNNFKESINSWKKYHPNYKYILWTENDIFKMFADKFPDVLEKIKYIKKNDKIIVVDIARLCILYIYGGIYSDLDVIAHRNYDKLLEKDTLIIPKTYPIGYANDLLISNLNNDILFKMISKFKIKNYIPIRFLRVFLSAGPLYVTKNINKSQNYSILPIEYYQGHITGNTWLSEKEDKIKSVYNKINKRLFISIYEKIDLFFIFLIRYKPKYLKIYYIFRLLDIFKTSSQKPLQRKNVILHSFYRLISLNMLNKEHQLYFWFQDLALVSLTEMKIIKLPEIFNKMIVLYVLFKHFYIIKKCSTKNIFKNYSNHLYIMNIIESFFHFYFLTPRNKLIKL